MCNISAILLFLGISTCLGHGFFVERIAIEFDGKVFPGYNCVSLSYVGQYISRKSELIDRNKICVGACVLYDKIQKNYI